jgi:hypothetical protein
MGELRSLRGVISSHSLVRDRLALCTAMVLTFTRTTRSKAVVWRAVLIAPITVIIRTILTSEGFDP